MVDINSKDVNAAIFSCLWETRDSIRWRGIFSPWDIYDALGREIAINLVWKHLEVMEDKGFLIPAETGWDRFRITEEGAQRLGLPRSWARPIPSEYR